jgi:ABC-type dipeptide/oligopeptide/nickel transport system ATPase subunit
MILPTLMHTVRHSCTLNTRTLPASEAISATWDTSWFSNHHIIFRLPQNARQAKISILDLDHPIKVAKVWGVDEELWDRDWSNLSGGEAQRVAMAVAVGLNAAEVLLLDGRSW